MGPACLTHCGWDPPPRAGRGAPGRGTAQSPRSDNSGPAGRTGWEVAWDTLRGEWGPHFSLLCFSYFSCQYFLIFLQDAPRALFIGSDPQVTQHLLPLPHPLILSVLLSNATATAFMAPGPLGPTPPRPLVFPPHCAALFRTLSLQPWVMSSLSHL